MANIDKYPTTPYYKRLSVERLYATGQIPVFRSILIHALYSSVVQCLNTISCVPLIDNKVYALSKGGKKGGKPTPF